MNFWEFLYGLVFMGGYPNWTAKATWDLIPAFIIFIAEITLPIAAILLIIWLLRHWKK